MTVSSQIRLDFLGGASAIGASSTLLEVGDLSILVDCGIRFRKGNALPDLDQLTGKKLDAILVTHAHTDHTGALPVIHEAFPSAPIYMTPPTLDLISILHRDALRLMDTAVELEGDFPLYNEGQVEALLSTIIPTHFAQPFTIGDVEVQFLPASHILGAAMVHLSTPEGRVLFTGDFSTSAQLTVPALDRPTLPVDLLITESTYGNRLHSDRKAAETRLVSRVSEVLEEGGRVLIPAFAIGRAQEILLILKQALRHKKMPEIPVYVDGMVRSVCGVYSSHPKYVTRGLQYEIQRRGHPFFSDPVEAVRKPEQRKQILESGSCVIVSSSGMLSGGPSASYAAAMVQNEKDAILITGYQDEESPGRALLQLAENSGPREIRLNDRVVPVRCSFETYGLSAHADRIQMVGLVEALRPRNVVLVHGDDEARETLADSLKRREVEIAEDGMRLAFHFPARRKTLPPRALSEKTLNREAIEGLLGPATGKPVAIAALAEAWFGRPVNLATREQFALMLEDSGLAKRDDNRRQFVWPQTEARRAPAASEEELALEEELKEENPKGKLLELCMRFRKTPRILATPQNGRHVAEIQLIVDGELRSSGVHEAHSEKLAEQLAARALLEQLSEALDDESAIAVDEDEAASLKLENPKGRLLEFCSRNRQMTPRLSSRPVPGGYMASFRMRVNGLPDTLETPFFKARTAKTAEQAAAQSMLQLIAEAQEKYDLSGAASQEDSEAALQEGSRTASQEDSEAALQDDSGAPSQEDFGVAGQSEACTGGAALAGETGNEGQEDSGTYPKKRPKLKSLKAKDPRMYLNELRQTRVVFDFGYIDVGRVGAQHQPVFQVQAWAEVPGSDRIMGEIAEGVTKKEAQRDAAERLLELVAPSQE